MNQIQVFSFLKNITNYEFYRDLNESELQNHWLNDVLARINDSRKRGASSKNVAQNGF